MSKRHKLSCPIKDGQVKVGDWILVVKGTTGKLTLAEVRMVNPFEKGGGGLSTFGVSVGDELYTDVGVFYPQHIIELRR